MTIKKSKSKSQSQSQSQSQGTISALTKQDLQLLRKFRIPDKLIVDAGIYRVSDPQARALGFQLGVKNCDLSGRIYPYVDEKGKPFNARLRRDHPEEGPDGKPQNKYISLSGKKRGLYWSPGAWDLLKLPDSEIVLVEAETSALAGTAYARRAGLKWVFAAMGGCWGWRDKETGTLADLVHLRGRRVHILLDSNVSTNPTVGEAELELVFHLTSEIRVAEVRCYRLPSNVNGPDDFLAVHEDLDFKRLFDHPVEPWLDRVGESYENYLAAKPPRFLIKNFLQSDGATFIGGLSGHGKTFLLLSMVLSLLTGAPLFDYFKVLDKAHRVIYITPEVTLGALKRRTELFRLGPYIENRRLVIRTLSAYPAISLTNPALLLAARGADIFLDPAVRFMEGDESSSKDNDRGLAAGIFGLLKSGARSLTSTHHSPKSFENSVYMSLENVLRGTGDIGAMLSTAWGVRMLDPTQMLVHVENIKPRDFEPPPPFQIQGRPHISEGRGFQMKTEPGQCGALRDYVKKKGGRPPSPERAERLVVISEAVALGKTQEQIVEALKANGMRVPKMSTLKTEMSEARKAIKGQKF